MYGQIHVVFKEMMLAKYGQDIWHKVLKEAKMDGEEDFLQFRNYADERFVGLIVAISDCVKESTENILEEFGYFFIKYCLRFGYDNMLRTLGNNIVNFVQNLDSLHSLLSLTYKGINPPSFRCEHNSKGELILHYYSCRTGLFPLVVGLIRAAGTEIFGHTVELTKLTSIREDLGEGRLQEHCTFSVHFPDLDDTDLPDSTAATPAHSSPGHAHHPEGATGGEHLPPNSLKEASITLTGRQFCRTFPYHVFFDDSLTILQCGEALRRLLPAGIGPGTKMGDVFTVQYPRMGWSVDNVKRFTNTIFMLSIKPRNGSTRKTLNIKGQMIWLEDEQRVMFIGSPRLKSLDEMKRMNIYMADIPLFDVTREIVLLYEQRNAEIGITQKLDLTMAELTRTSLALEVEKRKTEQLLHQMLPPKVAMQLKNGDIVEAETFQQATIMFSDIVGFTNIAATCPPETIVNMLNDMYERFDRATNSWDVYKVETIGDAYMVVGGVPELREDHSERVARFAMTIVQEAVQVPSPATGSPLQIRVGIHTGPVMAGVVGIKMPRYCLFGDTVNTASRMESHSVPGRIHLSREVFSQLVNKGFRMKKRGLIEVKGKGLLTTYFLVGDGHINVTEPEDKFMSFPVLTNDEQETTEPVASYVTKLSEEGSTDSGHCLDSQEKRKHVRSQHEAPDRRAMPISPRVVKPNYTFLSSASNQLQPTSTEKVRSSYCSVL